MRKIGTSRLSFRLPVLNGNMLYQIINIGVIKRSGHNINSWQIKVYLQQRFLTGERKLFGEIYERWINILEAAKLKIGSLWNDKGAQVELSTAVYKTNKNFVISDEVKGKVTNLQKAFEKYKYIGDLITDNFWGVAKEIPYFGIELSKKEYILIPCFELLRSLAYRGPDAINYFFSHSGLGLVIQDLCKPLQLPSIENGFSLELLFNFNSCADTDIRILAELAVSESFEKTLKSAHSIFLAEYAKKIMTNEKEHSYIKINPLSFDKKIEIKACGINVRYENAQYFIVCSINEIPNLYSYKKLTYAFATDNRKGVFGATSDSSKPISSSGVTIKPNVNTSDSSVLDSNEDAHSLMNRTKFLWENGDIYNLPSLCENPKLFTKTRSGTKDKIFVHTPISFSSTLGGKNLNIGGASVDYDSEKKKDEIQREEKTLSELFSEIAILFQSSFGKDIKLLTFNNNSKRHGYDISTFPTWWENHKPFFFSNGDPKKVGVIEISVSGSYYYYILIMGSLKRAGFVYKSNFEKFIEQEFNSIVLNLIADFNGNWSLFKGFYTRTNQKEKMKRARNFYINIQSRNQESAQAILDLCIKDIKKSKSI